MLRRREIVVAVVAAVIVLMLLVGGIFLNNNAYSIDEVHWKGNPIPPCIVNAATCGGHILGTDENARDEFARLVVGSQWTLGVSFSAALLEVALAVILGAAGRYGGTVVRFVVARVADAVSCIPPWPFIAVLVLCALMSHSKYGLKWWALAILLAALYWPRLWKASLLEEPHMLLNRALRDWGQIVLLLATVDFLGYGAFPPRPSWGNMLAGAEATIEDQWWAVLFPGLCLFLAVFLIEIGRRALSVAGAPKKQPH